MSVESKLIEAVYENGLPAAVAALGDDSSLSKLDRELVDTLGSVIRTHRQEVAKGTSELSRILTDEGVKCEGLTEESRLDGWAALRIEKNDVDVALRILAVQGFQPMWSLRPRAARARLKNEKREQLVRPSGLPSKLELTWGEFQADPQSLLTPRLADYAWLELPSVPGAYHLARLIRVLATRLGFKVGRGAPSPFLGTPSQLIGAMLDLVADQDGILLVDMGSGDGRVLVEAARRGWHARGIEKDPALVEASLARSRSEGVGDLIEVVEGDMRNFDLAGASVVFAFLPTDQFESGLATWLGAMERGAVLIGHEQTRPSFSIPPQKSQIVAAEDQLTIAHIWSA
jgi:dihydroxyacetone kinase DhaKLM complex PTS-EIIA-like component DhaM